MATYIDWMRSCSRITVSAHPAVSVPAGLTEPPSTPPASSLPASPPPASTPPASTPLASTPLASTPLASSLPASPPSALPVGLQLVGPYGSDRRLLEIAAAITELLGPVTPGPLP
jgi:subtilase-type serine protease